MTAEEIMALPERGLVTYRQEVQPDGRTVNIPYVEWLCPTETKPEDVMLVIDESGQGWMPFKTVSGMYRRRV